MKMLKKVICLCAFCLLCLCGSMSASAESYPLGDMDQSGQVTADDLTVLARAIGKIGDLPADGHTLGDMNRNGDVGSDDLTLLARLVGGISALPRVGVRYLVKPEYTSTETGFTYRINTDGVSCTLTGTTLDPQELVIPAFLLHRPYQTLVGATPYADSSAEGHAPENATDGDRSTAWCSVARGDPWWLALSFDEPRTVLGVELLWDGGFTDLLTLEVSSDGKTWTEKDFYASEDELLLTEPCIGTAVRISHASVEDDPSYADKQNNKIYEIAPFLSDPADEVSLTVTALAPNAFRGKSCRTATVGENVKDIGAGAFSQCSPLESISLPDGLVSLGDEAFSECRVLKSVCLPQSVKSLGYGVFSSCSQLQSVTLPDGIKAVPSSFFAGCQSLKSVNIPEGVEVIKRNAFSDCVCLSPLTLPDSLTEIEDRAFYAAGMNALTFGKGLKTIGNSAFSGAARLKNLVLPDGVEQIGNDAFFNCGALESVFLPDTVTSLGERAFCRCDKLADVTLSKGLTVIPDSCFNGCHSLLNITVPAGVKTIGMQAFSQCRSLASASLPGSLTAIGQQAFAGCSALDNVVFPEGLKSIGTEAFCGCRALEAVCLPDSLTLLSAQAFAECTSVRTITVGAQNPVFRAENNCLIRRAGNILVLGCRTSEIPADVRAIGAYAFYGCSFLRSVVIPEGVEEIGQEAFCRCYTLTTISLPASLKVLQKDAFAQVTEGTVTFAGTREMWNALTSSAPWDYTMPKTVVCSDD